MAEGQSSWVKPCAIGCLVLILLGVLGIVGIYFFAKTMMNKGAGLISEQIVADYEKTKADGKVPPEHVPLFDEVVAAAQQEDVTVWTALLVAVAVGDVFSDGQVNDEELKTAESCARLLARKPEPGSWGFGQFIEQHPELQGKMQELQTQIQQQAAQQQAIPEETVEPVGEEPQVEPEAAEPVEAPAV